MLYAAFVIRKIDPKNVDKNGVLFWPYVSTSKKFCFLKHMNFNILTRGFILHAAIGLSVSNILDKDQGCQCQRWILRPNIKVRSASFLTYLCRIRFGALKHRYVNGSNFFVSVWTEVSWPDVEVPWLTLRIGVVLIFSRHRPRLSRGYHSPVLEKTKVFTFK